MKRFTITLAAAAAGLAISIGTGVPSAHAARAKVDCDAVMQKLNSGKKAKEVARDLSISTSSVYHCKKKEMAAAKTGAKAGNEPAAKPAASPATAKP